MAAPLHRFRPRGGVLAAYPRAVQARHEPYFNSLDSQERPRPRASTSPGHALSPEAEARLRREGASLPAEAFSAMRDLLDDVDQAFDSAFEMLEERVSATVRGSSSSGHVDAMVTASGTLTALEYDERWLENAHSFNLSRETTEAIQDAYRNTADLSMDAIGERSEMTRVRELAADPQQLVRFLGL